MRQFLSARKSRPEALTKAQSHTTSAVIRGITIVLALSFGVQTALARGTRKTKTPPNNVSVVALPEITPAPKVATPKPEAEAKYKKTKYDEELLDKHSVIIIERHAEPSNATEYTQEEFAKMVANKELPRLEYHFDLRAIYEDRDALAVAMGLMEDDGSVKFKKCKSFRKNRDGEMVPCGYFYTAWRIEPGKEPVSLAGKRGGYSFDEFSQALGVGAKNIDDYYNKEYGISRTNLKWAVGGTLGALGAGAWIWRYKAWARKIDAWREAGKTDKQLWAGARLMQGWASWFVGHDRKVLGKTAFGRGAKKVGFFIKDKMMFTIGAHMYICTFTGHNAASNVTSNSIASYQCGLLGMPWVPSFGEMILGGLFKNDDGIAKVGGWLDNRATRAIGEMGFITGKMAETQCLLGALLPKESDAAFSCGNDAALKANEKFSMKAALAESSQELEDIELEEDDADIEAFEAYEKRMDEERERMRKKIEQEKWLGQQQLAIATVMADVIDPQHAERGIDFEQKAVKRFFSIKFSKNPKKGIVTTPGTRYQPKYEDIRAKAESDEEQRP
ncbi:MAG TPA: hypothetical protein PLH57_08370 [Oligoflexia bacterium]|nr:hypothetical protein [Oligoflexia bacterium]